MIFGSDFLEIGQADFDETKTNRCSGRWRIRMRAISIFYNFVIFNVPNLFWDILGHISNFVQLTALTFGAVETSNDE